ncbi:MAG: metallophosphoesterase [Desulfurococcaceae archaeon]
MLILATSDVHSPEYLPLYLDALRNTLTEPEVVLFAGDMVDKNKVLMFKRVYEATKRRFPSAPVIATFGNEEYRGYEKLYEQLFKDITWLNDSYTKLCEGELCIIGTRGGLDKPTTWQTRNIPGIEKYYIELPFKVEQMALELRRAGCKKIILLSHYGVTRKNLIGEKQEVYPYLASSRFERILRKELIDMVIHGHVHMGSLEVVHVRDVPVYNVSLPARRKLVEVRI